MDMHTYEQPLAVTPFGAQEHVPDWHESHAMSVYVPPSQLGRWVRTDLGVRTFQGLGKNAPLRAQVVRRLTKDAHTHQILESLPCDPHLHVSLHRRCLPGCGPQSCATRDIQTTFVYRLNPSLLTPYVASRELSPAPFPSGGGGGLSLSSSLSPPSLSLLLRDPTISQFPVEGTSQDSTFGTQTILAMRRFLDDAELHSRQRMPISSAASQATREVTNEKGAEGKGEASAEDECRQTEAMQEVLRAFRTLLHEHEEQKCLVDQQESESCGSEAEEAEEALCQESPCVMMAQSAIEEDWQEPIREPQRYLCDDWIQPVQVIRQPRTMTAKEKRKANVVKNCLIVTMMSLEIGFGSVVERYRSARDAVVERYQQGGPENPTFLPSELLTDDEMSARTTQPDEAIAVSLAPASMPPPTCLLKGKEAEALSQVHAVALKDPSLKMYHVMSVKQTLREDLAECAYQFSCRAADWSRSDMHAVPMQNLWSYM